MLDPQQVLALIGDAVVDPMEPASVKSAKIVPRAETAAEIAANRVFDALMLQLHDIAVFAAGEIGGLDLRGGPYLRQKRDPWERLLLAAAGLALVCRSLADRRMSLELSPETSLYSVPLVGHHDDSAHLYSAGGLDLGAIRIEVGERRRTPGGHSSRTWLRFRRIDRA